MLYIDAVCKGIDEIPTITDEIRREVVAHYEKVGLAVLCEELKVLDPVYYAEVDLNNHKRVIHAIEICRQTGGRYSDLRTRRVKSRPFRIKNRIDSSTGRAIRADKSESGTNDCRWLGR